jgi:hypothetical protein
MDARPTSTRQKALALNLDKSKYGTIAEIGAGQEVARWFFVVGGAAGTVAKTISAYDMAVSDAIYGQAPRYVSRQRLQAMLEYEFSQLLEGLGGTRGDTTTFFAFADTVATRSYKRVEDGRGWVGIRFQRRPGEAPSDVLVHVNLKDTTATLQQEALGIVGVNLIYAAYHLHAEPEALIGSLMDELSRDRLEVDMIKLSGPAFDGVDNRLMSLQLVEQNLTDAAVFTAAGEVVQPSEVFYKKPVLVERGKLPAGDQAHPRSAGGSARAVPGGAGGQGAGAGGADGDDAAKPYRRLPRRRLPRGSRRLSRPRGPPRSARPRRPHLPLRAVLPACRVSQLLHGSPDRDRGGAAQHPGDRRGELYKGLDGGMLESTGRLFQRSVKMYAYPFLDPATGAW